MAGAGMGQQKKKDIASEEASRQRCKTTIDSSVKAASAKATPIKKDILSFETVAASSNPTPAVAEAAPAPLEAATSRDDNGSRDRRNNPDGRRGRFAEKAPAGTRTKMLKIIYERKADIQEKRRYRLIIKIIAAVVLCGSVFFAGRATINTAYQAAQTIYKSLQVENWYDRFSTPVKLPAEPKAYNPAPAAKAKAPKQATQITVKKPAVASKKVPAKAHKKTKPKSKNSKLPKHK